MFACKARKAGWHVRQARQKTRGTSSPCRLCKTLKAFRSQGQVRNVRHVNKRTSKVPGAQKHTGHAI